MTDTTTAQATGSPAPMPVFHYAITLHWEALSGIQTATQAGTMRPSPGQTRGEVFNHLLADAKRKMGATDPVVLFYCLEPDAL